MTNGARYFQHFGGIDKGDEAPRTYFREQHKGIEYQTKSENQFGLVRGSCSRGEPGVTAKVGRAIPRPPFPGSPSPAGRLRRYHAAHWARTHTNIL